MFAVPRMQNISLEALHKFPSVKNVRQVQHCHSFVSTRWAFFSYAGMVLTKTRSCMMDENFKQQLLLKANRHLVRTWSQITGTWTSLKIFPLHCYTASHSLHLNSCDMMMINIWRGADYCMYRQTFICTWTSVMWWLLMCEVMINAD